MNNPRDDTLIPAAAVRAMLGGICDMTLWRYTRNLRDFPQPLKFDVAGRRYWRHSDVVDFIAARRVGAERNGGSS